MKENVFINCERLPAGFLSAESPNASPLSASEEFESTTYVPPYLYSAINFAVKDVPAKTNTYSGIGKLQAPVVTSLEGNESEYVMSMHPNPTEGVVFLSAISKWTLVNAFGETISIGHSDRLDLSRYSSGIYFLKIGTSTLKMYKI